MASRFGVWGVLSQNQSKSLPYRIESVQHVVAAAPRRASAGARVRLRLWRWPFVEGGPHRAFGRTDRSRRLHRSAPPQAAPGPPRPDPVPDRVRSRLLRRTTTAPTVSNTIHPTRGPLRTARFVLLRHVGARLRHDDGRRRYRTCPLGTPMKGRSIAHESHESTRMKPLSCAFVSSGFVSIRVIRGPHSF